jgi:hypothetical protein
MSKTHKRVARWFGASAALAVLLAGSASALGQGPEVLLKNDRFPADLTEAPSNAQMSVQVGYVANEVAAATFLLPTDLRTGRVQVTKVQIFWSSTTPGSTGNTAVVGSSLVVYQGNVLSGLASLVFDSDNAGGDGFTPSMADGALNQFDLTDQDIIVQDTSQITVGYRFGAATNTSFGPSVVSDQPPGGLCAPSTCISPRNAIYGNNPPFQQANGWMNACSLPGSSSFCNISISGNFFMRVMVRRAAPVATTGCSPADIAASDGNPGADGAVNNGDFQCFFSRFFSGCDLPGSTPCGPADIAQSDASPGGDGQVDNGDFQLFFANFFNGCP